MKWWDCMPWSSVFECWVLSQFFHSPLSPSWRLVRWRNSCQRWRNSCQPEFVVWHCFLEYKVFWWTPVSKCFPQWVPFKHCTSALAVLLFAYWVLRLGYLSFLVSRIPPLQRRRHGDLGFIAGFGLLMGSWASLAGTLMTPPPPFPIAWCDMVEFIHITAQCQPTPVFLPGEFHGQRSLLGYSP